MEDRVTLLEKETKKEEKAAPAPEAKPKKQVRTEPKNVDRSSAIEKPNYDFIEELSEEEQKVIYKIEKDKPQKTKKKKNTRLRLALFSLVTCVCLSFGIYNIVDYFNVTNELNAVTEQYYLSLGNYLSKLATLDTASNYRELFETYPETPSLPSSVAKSSNWFDRICDFLARLFGG